MRLITDGGENKPTLDDLATKDDLESFKNDVQELLGNADDDHDHDHDHEGESWPFEFEPDELDEAIEAKSKAMLDHIADPEACSDPECDVIREKYGFTHEDEPEEEPEAEADAEEEPEEEDEPERGMFGARLE